MKKRTDLEDKVSTSLNEVFDFIENKVNEIETEIEYIEDDETPDFSKVKSLTKELSDLLY